MSIKRKRSDADGVLPSRRELRLAWLSCLALNLRRTARIVSAVYDDAVRPSGLRSTQFSILATIAVHPYASIADIANWVDADRTTLQRSIGILKRKSWIAVEKGATGNVRKLALTSQGKRKLADAYAQWATVQKEMLALVGTRNARTLLHGLRLIRKTTGTRGGRGT